jgi:hypothetical protein
LPKLAHATPAAWPSSPKRLWMALLVSVGARSGATAPIKRVKTCASPTCNGVAGSNPGSGKSGGVPGSVH